MYTVVRWFAGSEVRGSRLSIYHALDEPRVGVALAEDAIGRAVAERDVPFVALPVGRDRLDGREGRDGYPPSARCTPRTGVLFDATSTESTAIDGDTNRNSTFDANARRHREPKATNRERKPSPFQPLQP